MLRNERVSGSGSQNHRDGKSSEQESEADEDYHDPEFVNNFAVVDLQPKQIEEILHLNTSDHPGMSLVAVPLNSMNFLNWSRSIRRALGAKNKLERWMGFYLNLHLRLAIINNGSLLIT